MATCRNCAFLQYADLSTNVGECHRHPPQVFVRPVSLPAPSGGVAAQWPRVALTDWCGDYQLASAANAAPA